MLSQLTDNKTDTSISDQACSGLEQGILQDLYQLYRRINSGDSSISLSTRVIDPVYKYIFSFQKLAEYLVLIFKLNYNIMNTIDFLR